MLGVVLLLLGAVLLVAEAHVPSHGALGTAAVPALTAGVVLTLSGAGAAAGVVIAGGVVVALVGLGVAWLLVVKSVAAHRLAVRSGPPALTGRVATIRTVPEPFGQVAIDGALWRARMWDLEEQGAPMAVGSPVVIESVDGLTLTVRPAEEWEVR